MLINNIGGLPRTGSSTLVNLLNQHPQVFADSTSNFSGLLYHMIEFYRSNNNIVNNIIQDEIGTNRKILESYRNVINTWGSRTKEFTFLKDRGWNAFSELFLELYPESIHIILVRDIANIINSFEKVRYNNIKWQEPSDFFYRVQTEYLGKDSHLELNLRYLRDIINKKDNIPNNIVFIRFEDFIKNPEELLNIIQLKLKGLDPFKYNFNNIINTNNNLDVLDHYKTEHHNNPSKFKYKSEEETYYVNEELLYDIVLKEYNDIQKYFGYTHI